MSYQHAAPMILCCVAALTAAARVTQDRTALRVSIAGVEVPVAVQPRVSVQLQRGLTDEVQIQVAGALGVAYASTITKGVDVEVDAVRLDGSSTQVFNGAVVSLESGFEEARPLVLIRAVSSRPRVESEPPSFFQITSGPEGDARLIAFVPRLSSTSSIQEVLVTGLDSATGGRITGHATAPTILLGSGSDVVFGSRVVIDTDNRFASADEAHAFARKTLSELLTTRVSAEIVTNGSPDLNIGSLVEIQGVDAKFEGEYYVAGVEHRFGPESYGGYSSVFRLRRADLGMFRIPSIDDEVLVAFDHGDINQPYIVGSWWDCDTKPPSERSDTNDHCRLLRWPW
jgi:hypothetical protein